MAFFMLMAFFFPSAYAQSDIVLINKPVPNPIDSDITIVLRSRLRAKGITDDNLREQVIQNLRKNSTYYDYQRVEIKGIWSKEDTDISSPDMFDKQIEPSHIADKDSSTILPTPPWLQSIINRVADLQDLHGDTQQQITRAAKTAVRVLQGEEVKEIVAHSWGTEIVYNAILVGAISPPKRLILAGMPDRDLKKWTVLSQYTGTEVILYSNSLDSAAGAARLIGGIRDSAIAAAAVDAGISDSGAILIRNQNAFELQWRAACSKPRVCNPHLRSAPEPIIRSDYKDLSHSRLLYYRSMFEHGDLRGSASEMAAEQKALIEGMESHLYDLEIRKELGTIEALRTSGNSSFLDGIASMKNVTQYAKEIALAQERIALEELNRDPDYIAYRNDIENMRRASDRATREYYERLNEEERGRARLRAARWSDMKKRWEYLQNMTNLGCADPDRLEFLGQIGSVPGVSLDDVPRFSMPNLVAVTGSLTLPQNLGQKLV